eukprot:scaffold63067_cov31-Tisochrysis_lutea.AAC.1
MERGRGGRSSGEREHKYSGKISHEPAGGVAQARARSRAASLVRRESSPAAAITRLVLTLLVASVHCGRVCHVTASRALPPRLSEAGAPGRQLRTSLPAAAFSTLFLEPLSLPPLAPGFCVGVALPDADAHLPIQIASDSLARSTSHLTPGVTTSAVVRTISRLGVPTAELHPQELARLEKLRTVGRQLEYAAGRIALRRALLLTGNTYGSHPLLSNEFGAVDMPKRKGSEGALLLGSISHTKGLCVAIVAGSDDHCCNLSPVVGFDIDDLRGVCAATEPDVNESKTPEHMCAPRAAVGVDIERVDRRPMTKLGQRILGEMERRDLQVRVALHTAPRHLRMARTSSKDQNYARCFPPIGGTDANERAYDEHGG